MTSELCPDCGRDSLVLEVWATEGGRVRCSRKDCGWWEPAVTEDDE